MLSRFFSRARSDDGRGDTFQRHADRRLDDFRVEGEWKLWESAEYSERRVLDELRASRKQRRATLLTPGSTISRVSSRDSAIIAAPDNRRPLRNERFVPGTLSRGFIGDLFLPL